MARTLHKLSARFVASTTEVGRHGDGGGLYLNVSTNGGRRWVFMFRQAGKLREMGLGSARDISLAKARERAQAARDMLADGKDPIAEKQAGPVTQPEKPTFGAAAKAYVDAMAPGWRNPKHVDQWRSTLGIVAAKPERIRIDEAAQAAHVAALKRLRELPIDRVETADVLAVVQPIWLLKNETAARLRGRIEAVLDSAAAQGQRSELNPARWRGHLQKLLPKRSKLARGHHAALPYAEVPAFIERLRQIDGISARALEFTILTAGRSGETLGALWAEIDVPNATWTIPGHRMKGGRQHRVPLTDRAVAILEEMARLKPEGAADAFVFPGMKPGRGLSNMALQMLMRRMEVAHFTPHGFRSSFRDWAGEETPFPREVAEAALAHIVGDETERAYRRSDALEKRRALMLAWAAFCAPKDAHNVVPLRRA